MAQASNEIIELSFLFFVLHNDNWGIFKKKSTDINL